MGDRACTTNGYIDKLYYSILREVYTHKALQIQLQSSITPCPIMILDRILTPSSSPHPRIVVKLDPFHTLGRKSYELSEAEGWRTHKLS